MVKLVYWVRHLSYLSIEYIGGMTFCRKNVLCKFVGGIKCI